MKLAKKAFVIALVMLTLVFTMSAQTLRSANDPRNTAPTVGTGGPPGGPTGLFTVYDGQTLRRGEFTFSAAYSNFDRDPGDVDIVEVPLSFQVGLNDYLELWFNTDALRQIKVNSPRNLSSFYLPNSRLNIGGVSVSGPAIVLGPTNFAGGQFAGQSVFRPQGNQVFVGYPYIGGPTGSYGLNPVLFPSGTLGPVIAGGSGADAFPGIGSPVGSILPGVVLATTCISTGTTCLPFATAPTVFSIAPSYLPDAPFINRTYGESSFSTFSVGAKWRWTGPNNPIGVGIIPFYRWTADSADDFGGWNQLQRGSSTGGGSFFGGGGRGDIGAILFADVRARKWLNISGNIGYIYNSSVKADFSGIGGGDDVTLLDRPDEVLAAIAVDFPVNKYFQPILEFRSLQYVGGRTPNAFENSPMDAIMGARIYPTRWFSLGGWYRYHANQQDRDSLEDSDGGGTVTVTGRIPATQTVTFTGVPPGFRPSSDPHGFGFQATIGRRNRRQDVIMNVPAVVNSVTLSQREVVIPCPPGYVPREGQVCPDGTSVNVSTSASDAENDVLTYNYTVSGGRIVGTGANVSWDLSGARPGTYTITVGVDDGCGVCGQTRTETITVRECDCVLACITCPTVDVTGPSAITRPGETMTFTANVSGGGSDTTYNWTVSQGEIISGQGTPVITVQTTRDMAGGNVTATVNIMGANWCQPCAPSDSETAGIEGLPVARMVDEFGPLSNDDVKARIQNFYVELNADPTAQGYIINYGTDREIARREKQIRDAIAFLRLDPSRVTIVNGGANPDGPGVKTRLWVVPAGAENPNP